MINKIVIKADNRPETGKKESKKVRREGRIPGVLYGIDANVHFSVEPADVKDLIYSPDFKLVELTIGGKTYSCILKDVQYHPVTDAIVHIDFLGLIPGKPVKLELPIRFKGQSPGVKLGGKLSQSLRRAKVKTVPENIQTELFVDVSKLELGQSVRVRDIVVPEGIEIINTPGIPVATVITPRALRSAAAAANKEK